MEGDSEWPDTGNSTPTLSESQLVALFAQYCGAGGAPGSPALDQTPGAHQVSHSLALS